jgi:hypothetical protein
MQNQDLSIYCQAQASSMSSSQVIPAIEQDHPGASQQPRKKIQQPATGASIVNPSPASPFPEYLLHMFTDLAMLLGLEEKAVALWLEEYACLPPRVLLHFLHQIRKYRLDPLSDEIILLKNPEGQYQTLITVDGWIKLINQDPQFAGMTLKESNELEAGIPCWMECSIYRHDRILPITIKEYFAEMKVEQTLWKTMPRRMLRHRTIQQCARLAFGIHVGEHRSSLESISPQEQTLSPLMEDPQTMNPNRTAWLKQRLKSGKP